MGAKASTPTNGTASSVPHSQPHVHSQPHSAQNARTRTFSSSSSSATEVIPSGSGAAFSLLRSIPGMHGAAVNQSTIDRQRARSLSSVPDLQQSNSNGAAQNHYLNGKPCLLSTLSKSLMHEFYHCLLNNIAKICSHSYPTNPRLEHRSGDTTSDTSSRCR